MINLNPDATPEAQEKFKDLFLKVSELLAQSTKDARLAGNVLASLLAQITVEIQPEKDDYKVVRAFRQHLEYRRRRQKEKPAAPAQPERAN